MRFMLILFLGISTGLFGQSRLIDRSGRITFFSEAPVENIEATTNQALAAIDTSNRNVAVSLLMKSFSFEKSLMQEHFNENYVESDKYPKATFKGNISEEFNFYEIGKTEVTVQGEISLHGETRPFKTRVTIDVTAEEIRVSAVFNLSVADFKIKIPKVVINNIAEVVEVRTTFKFEK
jgi:polyisoprenoid-binding protein YceI